MNYEKIVLRETQFYRRGWVGGVEKLQLLQGGHRARIMSSCPEMRLKKQNKKLHSMNSFPPNTVLMSMSSRMHTKKNITVFCPWRKQGTRNSSGDKLCLSSSVGLHCAEWLSVPGLACEWEEMVSSKCRCV